MVLRMDDILILVENDNEHYENLECVWHCEKIWFGIEIGKMCFHGIWGNLFSFELIKMELTCYMEKYQIYSVLKHLKILHNQDHFWYAELLS